NAKFAPTAAASSASAFADYFRDLGSLLFEAAQGYYEARMERAQMRLAHTRYLDGSPLVPARRPAQCR
ncbi:MAG TPA: hypothetical protein VMC05_14930, partial [Xanthobacteraceae bacterium]|nr:hypothetical protein [Xanthobacteraceae bacterium]